MTSIVQIFESWNITESPLYSMDDLLNWIQNRNKEIYVNIRQMPLSSMESWSYDENEGCIKHKSDGFFKIVGIAEYEKDKLIAEQPIILQPEIGYLGILGKVIDGILYFLMQAKIEPGNVNKVQISPTLQATKSNYMRVHGGDAPRYLEYFVNKQEHEIIVDQIQSEQSARFYGKRNRNMIIIVDSNVSVPIDENYRWMTLGQIKALMNYDNIVNMDTRTVISCIPFSLKDYKYKELTHIRSLFKDREFFDSMFMGNYENRINAVYHYINDLKMNGDSKTKFVKLSELNKWNFKDNSFTDNKSDFDVIFCDIEINGREVSKWNQPLLRAKRKLIFGLFVTKTSGRTEFLVHCMSEIGCFDKVELGPTIQGHLDTLENKDVVQKLFYDKYKSKAGIIFSKLFSEEGGRFYHEQNRNIMIEISKNEISSLPDGYFWLDYMTLNLLIQFNNCLNIQLRNLLSILNI